MKITRRKHLHQLLLKVLYCMSRMNPKMNLALSRNLSLSDYTAKSVEQMPDDTFRADGSVMTANSKSGEHSRPVQYVAPDVAMSSPGSCGIELALVSELGKDVEIKSDSLEQ